MVSSYAGGLGPREGRDRGPAVDRKAGSDPSVTGAILTGLQVRESHDECEMHIHHGYQCRAILPRN